MPSFPLLLLTFLLVIAIAAPGAWAFGAGEIPDYAYLSDKAFRHGDLENTLKEMYKIISGHHSINFGGGAAGILGGIASALKNAKGGTKFSSMDVKRVYLGNFLCDYSQAMDIAGLSKLTPNSIVTIVMALAFMSFGFATAEFQVTEERLGVYLPVTHIDNPKGYGEGKDPRDVHPKLRPPVDPEELEIDESNGMKNYIATEGRSWDTSTGLLKRVFSQCIEHGRRAGGHDGDDLYEAFRLLGTGLHTLEDLLAHSNWCELTLRKLGHQDVFCHVGENVLVNAPDGSRVPPLITGTFGSADFLHSLLGEATDHLSEASLTDLTKRLGNAKTQSQSEGSPIEKLTGLLSKLPSSGSEDKMQQGEEMKSKAINLNIDDVAPEEVQKQLWDVLVWRDNLMKDIANTISRIPGLESLLDQLTEALNVYVFTILEPFMTPILQQATGTLQTGSTAIIDANHEDQFQVFNDPDASDPSHSLLSKDHFALILNEPAGKVAMVVVKHTVELVVQAWYDESIDVDQTIGQILEAFHHPNYATGRSQVQQDMEDELRRWIEGMSEEDQEITLRNLTKQSVRDGKNKRAGHEDTDTSEHEHVSVPTYSAHPGGREYGGYGEQQQQPYGGESGGYGGQSETYGHQPEGYGGQSEYGHRSEGYGGGQSEGYGRQAEGYGGQSEGYGRQSEGYGGQTEGYGGRAEGYGGQSEGYGGRSEGYGGGGYGRPQEGEESSRYGGGGGDGDGYPSRRREEESESRGYSHSNEGYGRSNEGGYGRSNEEYGRSEDTGYGDRSEGYGGGESGGYGRRDENEGGYGGERPETAGRWNDNEQSGYRHPTEGYGGGYGRSEEQSYGSRREEGYGGGDDNEYGRSRGGDEDETYGAERLNLDDEGEQRSRRSEYGEGYGGGGEYESQY